ncbi:MAG: pilus assembly protein [Anaerolineae bacterium]|nr:pilus assembly protein [Anaerolineae bacterium]
MRQQRGQSLTELALLLPLLLAMIGIMLDMGRGVQAYVVAQNAAREAARYVSAHPTDVNGAIDAARAEIQRGGLLSSRLTVSISGGNTSGDTAQVDVTYNMPLVFGLLDSSQIAIRAHAESVVY